MLNEMCVWQSLWEFEGAAANVGWMGPGITRGIQKRQLQRVGWFFQRSSRVRAGGEWF